MDEFAFLRAMFRRLDEMNRFQRLGGHQTRPDER